MDRIKVTRTLLEKDENLLTPEEAAAVKSHRSTQKMFDERLEQSNKNIVKNCKILCSGHERWPVPAYGWIPYAEDLYYKLEDMNYRYRKYGISVVLDQAKEKFATFRVYVSTNVREIGFIGFLNRPFHWISRKLENLDYGIKYVVDKPGFYSLGWDELTKEQFDKKTDKFGSPLSGNVVEVESKSDADVSKLRETTYICEENGKYYKSYMLQHMPERHPVFTRHRFLYKIFILSNKIASFFSGFYKRPLVQTVMIESFDREADKLIRETEAKCENVCQDCGNRFSNTDDYYAKCETLGWYNYVCERCAMARGGTYTKFNRTDRMVFQEGVERPDLARRGNPVDGGSAL